MEKLIITGSSRLRGEVNISGAKNSSLPIMAACILSSDKSIIENVPMLEDVLSLGQILQSINAGVKIDQNSKSVFIDTSNIINMEPSYDVVRKMRASFLIMGPMLARFGEFKISLPGGCNIGSRPIDLHLKGFNLMGAKTVIDHGYVEVRADKLRGNKIYLDFPSVGATENIMMAAVMAEGETVIENAAAEPEIVDLSKFLNKMGAQIVGAGTDNIKIIGVKELHGSNHKLIYDRIEAGTFMAAAAITKSRIKINGINDEHLKPIIAKLQEAGASINILDNSMIIDGDCDLKPIDIKTMPYPGFPTDMQPQMMAFLTSLTGTSMITETVFENRFMHVTEMKRLGANIRIDGRCAVIEGGNKLTGTIVKATDLRAGAALVLCGLIAEGETVITDIYHIDRGYELIEEKFRILGAGIRRAAF